jgi:hypothetical protein
MNTTDNTQISAPPCAPCGDCRACLGPDPTQKSDPASAPATPEPPRRRSRTGKIARLPRAIREQLNGRLCDGEQGKRLLKWLNKLPEVQEVMDAEFDGQLITESNLSHWREGGYKDWEKAQAMKEAVLTFVDEIRGLQEATQEQLTNLMAFHMAAQMMLELKQLESVAQGAEKERLRGELLKNVVALRRGDLELERLRLQRERYGLKHKTKEEREAEFWKWAEDNINRDEFCRRRCFTYEQREAAIDKILGITPEERHEVVPQKNDNPPTQAGAAAPTEAD